MESFGNFVESAIETPICCELKQHLDKLYELYIKRGRLKMTKEEQEKILKLLVEERNDYVRECRNRIDTEKGKAEGADYMLQRFLNILNNSDFILGVKND